MSLFPRLASVKPPPNAISLSKQRAYSIFSKPGGGRFVNTSKPLKGIATTTTQGSSTSSTSHRANENSSESPTANAGANSGADEAVEMRETHDSSLGQNAPSTASNMGEITDQESGQASFTTSSFGAWPGSEHARSPLFAEEGSIHHPKPPHDQVLLHSFFSMHRPMILLPLHAQGSLFNGLSAESRRFGVGAEEEITRTKENEESEAALEEGSLSPFEVDLASGKPLVSRDGNSIQVQIGEEDIPEADADAARLLGRTYVLNQIGSLMDWQSVLKTLGDKEATVEMENIKTVVDKIAKEAEEADAQIRLDSVKRKRKRKMNKHM